MAFYNDKPVVIVCHFFCYFSGYYHLHFYELSRYCIRINSLKICKELFHKYIPTVFSIEVL